MINELRDSVDLLLEVESIEQTIAGFERLCGPRADFDDVRQRVQRVRANVLVQLRGLLSNRKHVSDLLETRH